VSNRYVKITSVIHDGAKKIAKRYDLYEGDELKAQTYNINEALEWRRE
jgi:TRAP-type uncharacterized transport system substrate-binding protein